MIHNLWMMPYQIERNRTCPSLNFFMAVSGILIEKVVPAGLVPFPGTFAVFCMSSIWSKKANGRNFTPGSAFGNGPAGDVIGRPGRPEP